MGRIADALKKAEQQRREKLAECGTALLGEDSGGRFANPSRTAVADMVPLTLPGEAANREPARQVQGMDESLVAYYDPSGLICEQYRTLRTRLLSQNPDNDHRIIAITSSLPRDGKSVTALNLSFIMSEIRHLKVLVVDGDFRRSSLASMLNVRSSPGLADLLRGEATYNDVIQETPMPNLFFVSAGETKGQSAADVLSVEGAASVFSMFRNQFHYTIVDTPPATTVSDVGIIGQHCNGVIMLVRMNRTPEPIARRAVRVLQVNNIPIIGTLLVGTDGQTHGYGYYRYYNYYRYYYKPRGESSKR